MEQILFGCLPASDSVRMSFVSRTWQSLWNSLPVSSNFKFDMSHMTTPACRIHGKENSIEEFVTWVDNSLRILHEHKVGKHIIPSFYLSGTFSDEVQSSHVDRWMKLVTKNYVKTLVFDNDGIPWYKFPPAAFDAGSLVELSLEKCILKKDLIQEDTRFCCLKVLELNNVDLNGLVIGDLLSRCPSLENLGLSGCKNIEYLELVDFPKLRKVDLGLLESEAYEYKIESASLQALSYFDKVNPLDLDAVCCRNLEELNLYIHDQTITDKNIEKLIVKFPCLSKLALVANSFESADDVFKISSNQLKSLRITGEMYVKNINIDAPNLHTYHREDREIPHSFALNSVKLDIANHVLYHASLHTNGFLKLREYLGKFSPARRSALRIVWPLEAVSQQKQALS